MSLRRAAPGPQLSVGRIRVDAAKAIAKLREYQLADRNAWVLEAIRAAVAAKAARIMLRADANDVWLSWQGEPWPAEILPRLFDELVSPEPASENHHVRLLGAAINSALGTRPAHVDVIAIREGMATRVRYTPEILANESAAPGELGESTLRHVMPETIAPPENLPAGMLVHLRRRLVDWHVFSDAPELALAHAACRDITVPIEIAALVQHRDHTHDVIRVPLGEGIDGWIAVTEVERARSAAMLVIAERGVVLAEYVLPVLNGAQRSPVPIRAFIDAPRMPTNASRSQVRRDAFPIAEGEQRAHKLLGTLISELAKLAPTDERARTAALALLAAECGSSRWHVEVPSLHGPMRELAQLPLVRNAVGQPRALTNHWRAEVHLGDKPFPVELAPWLDDVLWAPAGDPASQLIDRAAVDTRGTRRLARWARRQLRAQKQFYAHSKREIRVLSSVEPHVRAPLGVEAPGTCIAQDIFENLRGEVCIYTDGNAGALAVLLEGRELERVEFDSPLSFDIVIDSPTVTPADRYRGVKRDAWYKHVERAMRAGLVRALEAHVRAKRDAGHAAIDAKLFRKGIHVLAELGLPLRGLLALAPAYRTSDGQWLSLADLAKEKVLGIVAPGTTPTLPSGRVVIELADADRKQLTSVVSATIVPYRSVVADRSVARGLIFQRGGALIIREPGMIAVLTPSSRPQLRLLHLGAELAVLTYLWHWLPCTIAIDSDALVPDEDWSGLVDDAGFPNRNYDAWEQQLARAIANALAGDKPAELVSDRPIELDGPLGQALCEAILRYEPKDLLGAEVIEKLCNARILRVLGLPDLRSLNDLAKLFPAAIPYVDRDAGAVVDFTPLVATELIAKAMGRLAGRESVDGTDALQRHQRRAVRARNLAAHRQRPTRAVAIQAEHQIPIAGSIGRGVVGLHAGMFEIHVHVEGRLFTIIHPSDGDLPLIAAVEIADSQCDETFEAIYDDARRNIATEIRAAAPKLLASIAARDPQRLGDASPARTLLARTRISDEDIRTVIRTVPAFTTIQGGRISLEEAAQPRGIISGAAMTGEWLGPGDGEAPHALDAPILYVPSDEHELSRIVEQLHPGKLVDVTDDATRLQSRRRIARGLVPTPRVGVGAPELTRSLRDFGELGTNLGVGEIALVDQTIAQVSYHEDGIRKRSEYIDVLPPIALAVELANAQAVLEPAQKLAVELVKDVLAKCEVGLLSTWIQRNLFRAALARRLPREVLMPLPKWRDFIDQLEQFGDVWVVCQPTDLEPLDTKRKVFYLEVPTFELASQSGWAVVDATNELLLDATARRHQARKPARYLELPAREGVLAEVTLDGDGITSPRGIVGVLSPFQVDARGVWPHANMHPFDRVDDPCRWPTVAVIDDARLVPDRTWSAPQPNAEWQAIAKEVRQASERAVATVGEAPEDALAELRITPHLCADISALRKSPKSAIRGVLWLAGEPGRDVGIQVIDGRRGVRSFTADDRVAIGGKVMVFAADGLDVDLALRQLCGWSHGKLVRQLLKSDHLDKDLIAAHVAHALAVRTVRPTDVRGIEFPCFSPRPLDARQLASLLRSDGPVRVIKSSATPDPDLGIVELIDDGSLLARTLLADVGNRARRVASISKPRAAPVETAPPAPKPAPKPSKPAKPQPPHPLRDLVIKLRSRLGDLGIGFFRWVIVERAEPMIAFDEEIEIAGDNVRLRALAAAVLADSPFAEASIDVVVAHVVTVLNVALTQVTDAKEAHAIGVLLANRQSAGRPRSRQSS